MHSYELGSYLVILSQLSRHIVSQSKIHTYIYIYIHVHIHAYLRVRQYDEITYPTKLVCMYVHVYVYIYVCMYRTLSMTR